MTTQSYRVYGTFNDFGIVFDTGSLGNVTGMNMPVELVGAIMPNSTVVKASNTFVQQPTYEDVDINRVTAVGGTQKLVNSQVSIRAWTGFGEFCYGSTRDGSGC